VGRPSLIKRGCARGLLDTLDGSDERLPVRWGRLAASSVVELSDSDHSPLPNSPRDDGGATS